MQVSSKELSIKLKEAGLEQGISKICENGLVLIKKEYDDTFQTKTPFYWCAVDNENEVKLINGMVLNYGCDIRDFYGLIIIPIARAFTLDELLNECKKLGVNLFNIGGEYYIRELDGKYDVFIYSNRLVEKENPTEAVGYFLLWLLENKKK